MKVPEHIFREYDIRGVVGDEVTPAFAEALGRAFGTVVGGSSPLPAVAVGQDNRPSSEPLAAALSRGLSSAGVSVQRVGTVPTPALYYASHSLEAEGAVQVTGSHNPADYNGFKFVRDGSAFYGDRIRALARLMQTEDYSIGEGRIRRLRGLLDEYVEQVAERAPVPEGVKVVLDCGNGTGSVVAPRALRAAGAEVETLYCESDGTFPNHHPDPTVDENLRDLISRVTASGADLGVALDGDADRIGAVTGEGEIVRGDHLLLLFALDVLDRHRGATVLFDVKCSQALPRLIREAGGEPLMWKTGHSLIKQKMRETGSPVAGEMSGHIFFADKWFGFDDAIYASARLAALVGESGRSLTRLLERFPTYASTPELRLDCTDDRKFEVVEAAVRHYREDRDVVEVDGARVQFPGGWALIRASNTQPVVVVRIEADDRDRLAEIRDEVAGFLAAHDVSVPELDDGA